MFKLGSHPLNLGLRFILEMTALFSLAFWGWTQHEGWVSYLLAVGLPILFALIWGVFAVPNDPSRSGKTVIVTQGWIRLCIELMILFSGAIAFYDLNYKIIAGVLFGLILIHYTLSFDRINWLLKH